MTVDRSHETDNDSERSRLRGLLDAISEADLRRPMPGGWTASGVLAHLAFWDARALHLTAQYAAGRQPSPSDAEPEDVTWLNEAAKPLCLALAPREAANLALRLAEQTDQAVAALDDHTLASLQETGCPFGLSRAEHRREHLDEIERALRP
jgi:hypothetical protein